MLLTDTEISAETVLEEDVEQKMLQILDVESWIGNLGSSVLLFIIRVALCVLVYYVISRVLNKVIAVLDRWMEKQGTEQTARHYIGTLIKVVVLGFTIITMIVQLNIVEATSIAALIASAGVGISLAMQGVLSNFAGGILLLTLKPFKEGDFITVSSKDISGTVKKITLYYTTIQTPTREILQVPNSTLTDEPVSNCDLPPNLRRLTIKVTISYESDLQRALEILDEIMDEDERICKENRRTIIDEMNETGIVVGMRCLVDSYAYMDVNWDLKAVIWEHFTKEGITFPYRQVDVHVKEEEKEDALSSGGE